MIDLEDRIRTSLGDYAASVQPSPPLDDVEAVLDSTVTALHLSPARGAGRGRGRRVVMAAAAALIVAGAAALAQVGARDTDQATQTEPAAQVSAALSPDPPGPLYVLPADLDGVVLRNADRSTWQLPADVTTFDVLAGRPDGSGFVDLVGISVASWSPASGEDPAGGWTVIETADGTVHVGPSPFLRATRRHGDVWITVEPRYADLTQEPSSDAIDAAVAVLGTVELDADGRPMLSEATDLVVIDHYEMPASAGFTTYYDAWAGGVSYVVETAPGGLGSLARLADRVEPIELGGVPAWLLEDDQYGLVRAALMWRATPHRVVAIDARTDVDIETLLAFAAGFVTVSAAEWEAAFPDVDDQCFAVSADADLQECEPDD